MKQTKKIVEPAFVVVMYEVEKLIKDGWKLSQEREPIYIAGLYDVEMEKDLEFTPTHKEQLKEADIQGVVLPTVDGKVDEAVVEKVVQTAAPKRGPKPKVAK